MTEETVVAGPGCELPLIRSAVIPPRFRHGFTTRRGGVSSGPFDSFNLSAKWGDAPAAVAENWRRFQIAAGGGPVFFATQVHGRDSVLVPRIGETGETGVAGVTGAASFADVEAVAATRADAVIGARAGTAVGAYVADCVPVLIADVATGACAAVHAGWRGTVAGVIAATIRRMVKELGTRASDLRIAIGPSIGPCCFEVGPEVVAAVEAAFPGARAAGAIDDEALTPIRPRPHVDLWTLNRMAAESVGVPRESIDVGALCTSCDRARFYSYRRDGGVTGVSAAFIVCDQEPRNSTP